MPSMTTKINPGSALGFRITSSSRARVSYAKNNCHGPRKRVTQMKPEQHQLYARSCELPSTKPIVSGWPACAGHDTIFGFKPASSEKSQNRAGLARDLDLLVDVHAHEQAEAKHHGQHSGATIGDERHGNADDRNEAHHHRG